MKDFRIVNSKTVLKIISVAPIRNFRPPSIVVVGEKLDLTQEVLFNGVEAEEFVISAPTRLIVRIPPSQVGKPLTDLKALSSVSLTKKDALVSFEITKPAKKIEGIDRLVQSWLMLFMSTPGSDVFDKSSGGGGLALVGRTTNRNGKGVAADLALAVERSTAELRKKQGSDLRVPQSEKLLNCTLDSVEFDPDTTTLSGRVTIQNMLGDAAEVTLR